MLLTIIATLFTGQDVHAASTTAHDLGSPVTRQISSGGTTQIVSTPLGTDKFQKPEIDQVFTGLSADTATPDATRQGGKKMAWS